MLWGLIQHTAWDSGINRFSTNYASTLAGAFLYRATFGAMNSLAIWIQTLANGNNPFDATKYETISGKIAFVDHGWDLEANPAAIAPVEASLGFFNSVVPSGKPYPQALKFEAAFDANGKPLIRN